MGRWVGTICVTTGGDGNENCNPNPPANGAASQSLVADANIQITPATANNPVSTNHALVDHGERDLGGDGFGAWSAYGDGVDREWPG